MHGNSNIKKCVLRVCDFNQNGNITLISQNICCYQILEDVFSSFRVVTFVNIGNEPRYFELF